MLIELKILPIKPFRMNWQSSSLIEKFRINFFEITSLSLALDYHLKIINPLYSFFDKNETSNKKMRNKINEMKKSFFQFYIAVKAWLM